MPIYEFKCEPCDKRFEKITVTSTPAVHCPTCGKIAERQISSPSPFQWNCPKGY